MAFIPTIGITMGDPCGVGAEIIVKALAEPSLRGRARFVVWGLCEQVEYLADELELDFPFERQHHEDMRRFENNLVILDYDELDLPVSLPRGATKQGGVASMAFCQDAIAAAKAGLVDALVTAPISKTSWGLAGFDKWPGHTELLAEKFKIRHVAMMFIAPQLKVVLASIHEGLFELRNSFTIGCVFNPIDLADPPCASGLASSTRESRSAASTRTPARRAASGMRKTASSRPPSSWPARRASTSKVRSPPTPFF